MSALVPADLAQAIEREHTAATRDACSALEHAVRCGELLTEAKATVEHGAWLPWIEAQLSFGERQAQKYMRLADCKAELANTNSGSDFTINGALAALATPRPPQPERPEPEPEPDKSAHRPDSIFNRPFGGSFVPEDDDLAAAGLTQRLDRVINGPRTFRKTPRAEPKPEPPPGMVPAKEALLISWLRTGDTAQVAHRLRHELGDERMRQLWAHVPPYDEAALGPYRGLPRVEIGPGEGDEAELRAWACDRDTAFLSRQTGISADRLSRFKDGKALDYHGQNALRALRASIDANMAPGQ